MKPSQRKGERGASLVEYSILIALIMLIAITGVASVGEGVRNKFDIITEELVGGGSFQQPCNPTNPGWPSC